MAVSQEKIQERSRRQADFPAAIFLAGKCPNLWRDSISCCRKIGEEFSSSVEICRKTFPARNFGQPKAFSSFLILMVAIHGWLIWCSGRIHESPANTVALAKKVLPCLSTANEQVAVTDVSTCAWTVLILAAYASARKFFSSTGGDSAATSLIMLRAPV